MSAGLALTQATILEAKKQALASNDNTEFVVVILPFREQVYANADLQHQFDSINHALLDFFERNEVKVIDLTPDLRERVKTERNSLYFDEDIHLNTRGNEVVAELLQHKLAGILAQFHDK